MRRSLTLTACMTRLFCLSISAVLAAVPLHGQAATDENPVSLTIPDGTVVHLVLMDDLQSKKIKVDGEVHFAVREDVVVGHRVIVRTGSAVIGRVANLSKSGLLGKSGKIGLRIDSVTAVDGSLIKLRGGSGVGGGKGGALTWVSAMWFGPDASMPVGTMMNAFIDGDQPVAPKTPVP